MHTHINPHCQFQPSTSSIKNLYNFKEYCGYKVEYSEPRLYKQTLYLHCLALVLTHRPFIVDYLPINPLPPSVPVLQVLVRGCALVSCLEEPCFIFCKKSKYAAEVVNIALKGKSWSLTQKKVSGFKLHP